MAKSGWYFPKIRGGGVFRVFFTPVSEKRLEISKCAQGVNYCKLRNLQIWYLFFYTWNGFWEILKKSFFRENFFRGHGFQKRHDLGKMRLRCFSFLFSGNWESPPGQHSRGNISPKLRVGCFLRYFEPLFLKNGWRSQNKHAVLGRLRPHFFFLIHAFLHSVFKEESRLNLLRRGARHFYSNVITHNFDKRWRMANRGDFPFHGKS